MQSLIARIRWRLVGWNMLILALILGLLGTSVYVALSRSLLNEVDLTLFSRSEQALPILFPPREFGQGGPPAGRRPTEGYIGGVFFIAFGPDGTILRNPQQVTTSDLQWPSTSQPTFATITLTDGDEARVLLRRMPDGGMLVTGQSLVGDRPAE